MRIFFTADTHFSHANILRYTKRPWLRDTDIDEEGNWISSDIAKERTKEMDEALIANWNLVVKNEDTVYHLGDFAFRNHQEYKQRLNGTKIFVLGNHDKKPMILENPPPIRDLCINGQYITLCHYAMRVWNKSHFNAFHLYGHSHGCLRGDWGKSIDVGVDAHNFKPLSLEEVREIMKTKPDNFNWVKRLRGYNDREFEHAKQMALD